MGTDAKVIIWIPTKGRLQKRRQDKWEGGWLVNTEKGKINERKRRVRGEIKERQGWACDKEEEEFGLSSQRLRQHLVRVQGYPPTN